MLCVLIDCVAPDWSDICWATQLFTKSHCARVCLTSFGHMMSTISFFLLIDRYIVFVERRLTSRKAERFIVTRQFSPSALNCSLSSDFYFLFSFFFFHLWRTKQEGEYVLEKQVNGQGVSPYDPSHNSTAVLVGKPNLWFVISQWTADEIRDIFSFFIFVSTWMWTDVCNFHRRS